MTNTSMDYMAFFNTQWLRNRNYSLLQKSSRGDKNALTKISIPDIDYWKMDMDYIEKNYRIVNSFDSAVLYQRNDD